MRGLVSLRQYCGACLLQNVIFCLGSGFSSVIRIHDSAEGRRQVDRSSLHGGDRRAKAHHVGTVVGACRGHSGDIGGDIGNSSVSRQTFAGQYTNRCTGTCNLGAGSVNRSGRSGSCQSPDTCIFRNQSIRLSARGGPAELDGNLIQALQVFGDLSAVAVIGLRLRNCVIGIAVSTMQTTSVNLSASFSRIMDTDYAAETAAQAKNNILQQAGTAVLAQANQTPQTVLSLLR